MEQRRYSVLKAGKMENFKDFSEFDKRPNWRRLGQSIPSTAAFVGCSCGALVVSIETGSRKQQWWTSNRLMGGPGSVMHRRAIVAQIWLWWQVSEYTVHTGLNWRLKKTWMNSFLRPEINFPSTFRQLFEQLPVRPQDTADWHSAWW